MPKRFLDKVITKFTEVATKQEIKGIEKYGHELQPMDQKWDWLKMAGEEIVDAYKYLEAERERRDFLIKEIEEQIRDARQCTNDHEIILYLNVALDDLQKLRGEK